MMRKENAAEGIKVEADAAVAKYLLDIPDEQRRIDMRAVMQIMAAVSGEAACMWGGIIGYGRYRYRYASGREGDTFIMGLASRKDAMVLHLGPGIDQQTDLLERLGSHRMGKGCLYLRKLDSVDMAALNELLRVAAGARYGVS